MKKLIAGLGVFFGLSVMAGISRAGIPVENYYMGQSPLSNTSIVISSASTNGTASLSMSVSPASQSSGGGTYSCRVCFTNFVVQIESTTVVTILDAGTTDYTIYGAGIGTNAVNTLSINRDHLGPVCFGAGDTAYIKATVGTGDAAGNPQSIIAEGYTNCGGTLNKGPMQ